MKTCLDCSSQKPESDFGVVKYQKKLRCIECHRIHGRAKSAASYVKARGHRTAQMRERYSMHKSLVLCHYGSRCACCGENELLFLSIDHVNNDGASHRKGNGGSSHNNIYAWLVRKKFPPGFQVLCMNCNHGKHRNRGVCPHIQEGSTIITKVSRAKRP